MSIARATSSRARPAPGRPIGVGVPCAGCSRARRRTSGGSWSSCSSAKCDRARSRGSCRTRSPVPPVCRRPTSGRPRCIPAASAQSPARRWRRVRRAWRASRCACSRRWRRCWPARPRTWGPHSNGSGQPPSSTSSTARGSSFTRPATKSACSRATSRTSPPGCRRWWSGPGPWRCARPCSRARPSRCGPMAGRIRSRSREAGSDDRRMSTPRAGRRRCHPSSSTACSSRERVRWWRCRIQRGPSDWRASFPRARGCPASLPRTRVTPSASCVARSMPATRA